MVVPPADVAPNPDVAPKVPVKYLHIIVTAI